MGNWSREMTPEYATGLVDGEGSFFAYRYQAGRSLGIVFSMQLRADDEILVKSCFDLIGAKYSVSRVPSRTNNRAPAVIYRCGDVEQLHNKVVPFFRAHPLIGKKSWDFLVWSRIVEASYHRSGPRWDADEKALVHFLVASLQASRKYGFGYESVVVPSSDYEGCSNRTPEQEQDSQRIH